MLLTVYVVLSFKKFNFLTPNELKKDFFEIPKTAKKISLDEIIPQDNSMMTTTEIDHRKNTSVEMEEGKVKYQDYNFRGSEDIEF